MHNDWSRRERRRRANSPMTYFLRTEPVNMYITSCNNDGLLSRNSHGKSDVKRLLIEILTAGCAI